MVKSLVLQNFRSYTKREFEFAAGTTLIVGPNASGKTNILEAIYALATGRSFRAENERELIRWEPSFAKATEGQGSFRAGTEHEVIRQSSFVTSVRGEADTNELEIIWDNRERFSKLFRVNGVGKRQVDFVGNLRAVMFSPQDIEIVADSPSTRRRYLDSVLSLVHRDYRVAVSIYERAMRNRNKILWKMREFGINGNSQLEYWDNLLINNGIIIHQIRKEYLEFLNNTEGGFFPVRLEYNHSIISEERLEKYQEQEIGAAVTLVGPHRDDFRISQKSKSKNTESDLKFYGSRGEQRMAVFTMKLGELEYVRQQAVDSGPILLLDDIFSELDHENRHRLLQVVPKQQTVMTTTDLHLVEKEYVKHVDVVELS